MSSKFRKQYLFQLHLHRAELLHAMVGMNTAQLEQALWDDYSTRRLLPHIALWEGFEANRLRLLIDGRLNEIVWTPVDERNAQWHAQSAEISIDGGIAMLQKERNSLLNVLADTPDALLQSTVKLDTHELPVMAIVTNSVGHDRDHANDIWEWRKANDAGTISNGPRSILVAYLRATRRALRALLDLIEGVGLQIDQWTPKDIVAHIAGWEPIVLQSLQQNRTYDVDGFDLINQQFADASAAQSVDDVWQAYANGRQAVIDYVERMTPEQLAQRFENPTDWQDTPYKWVRVFPEHDLEHIRELYSAWLIKTRVKQAK